MNFQGIRFAHLGLLGRSLLNHWFPLRGIHSVGTAVTHKCWRQALLSKIAAMVEVDAGPPEAIS